MAGKTSARPMTGGMAIVEALIANKVDRVFGLPGAQLYALFDALAQRSDVIATIGARHEQACAYMAFGYARSTGRPGVYAVVPGPGVLNTTAALATALGCNAPVLCITGQVPSTYLGRGRGHLHELPDQLATLRTLTKWAARIERAAEAPEVLHEAFRQMQSGRPGPVAVEMAWDVMTATGFVEPRSGVSLSPASAPSPLEIEAAARLVVGAERPMIMTGSGAQHAAVAVRTLAEELDAPVAAFRGGRGVVAEDHPLGISSYGAYRLWADTDVVIGIGTRLEMPYMRWPEIRTIIDRPPAPPHLIRIDIDASEMRRLVPHAGIVADADAGTRALLAAIRRMRNHVRSGDSKAARRRIATAKREARAAIEVVQPQLSYLDVIRAALPRDGFFVGELSQVGFTSYFGYPVYQPRTYVSEGHQGTLGFGFPTALGVKVAHPDKPVVAVTGDGGFMFGVQELATAVQYGIAVVILVFNNKSFGNVLRDQETGFGNRVIGAMLHNPDFVALAKAFGLEAHHVATPQALGALLTETLRSDKPALIEIAIPPHAEVSPWDFIHPRR
jgi:acetolactate synthase I/II/III large subunit